MSTGGGGGGVLPYVCILGMYRKRDPIFSSEFPFRSKTFLQISTHKIRSGASPFYIFGGFCRSGDHHFQNFFNFDPFIACHGRLCPNAAPRVSHADASWQFRRVLFSAPRVSQTRLGNSGESHFQRCGLARRVLAVPESFIFTLKTDQARSGAPPPPPPIFKRKMAQARSGAPHFHARPGARSGALANGTYLPKFGVSTSPPPRVSTTL